jgi:uncharacterized sodium:solute symporter family permease YidK
VQNAPGSAGVAALISGPILYGMFQTYAPGLHFLIQVAVTFQLVILIMALMTFWKPLEAPKPLPVRQDVDVQTRTEVKVIGGIVLILIGVFYILFW